MNIEKIVPVFDAPPDWQGMYYSLAMLVVNAYALSETESCNAKGALQIAVRQIKRNEAMLEQARTLFRLIENGAPFDGESRDAWKEKAKK